MKIPSLVKNAGTHEVFARKAAAMPWLAEIALVISGATVVRRIIAAVENCPAWQVGSIFATPIDCCDSCEFCSSDTRSSQADEKNRIQGFQSADTCVN